jgi:hypothetical protein
MAFYIHTILTADMFGNPWITLSRVEQASLRIHSRVYEGIPLPNSSQPSIITMIGKYQKSVILRELLGGPASTYPQVPHGQIHLWEDLEKNDHHVLFADVELPFNNDSHWTKQPLSGPTKSVSFDWWQPGTHDTKSLAAVICARILSPLSNVICIFASDFQGIKSTASFIHQLIQFYHQHDLCRLFKPRLVVIAPMKSRTNASTEEEMEAHLKSYLKSYIAGELPENDDNYVENLILTSFHSINVICLGSMMNARERARAIRKRLAIVDKDARTYRGLNRVQFSYKHLQSLLSLLVNHFCTDQSPFSFIRSSRPHGFSVVGLANHVETLLKNIPCEAWLWHCVIPLLSSSLLLATYPPHSHCKSN